MAMGNPLEPGIQERANVFGRHGWELVAIDAGTWIFKRPSTIKEAEEPLQAILEETVPLVQASIIQSTELREGHG